MAYHPFKLSGHKGCYYFVNEAGARITLDGASTGVFDTKKQANAEARRLGWIPKTEHGTHWVQFDPSMLGLVELISQLNEFLRAAQMPPKSGD